jgi:hypothetical protein
MACPGVEGRAYRQEAGKACLGVVIQLRRQISEEGMVRHWEGKVASRLVGRGMVACRDHRLEEGMAYRQVVVPYQEGSRRAWLLHQHGFHRATLGSRLLVLQRHMRR